MTQPSGQFLLRTEPDLHAALKAAARAAGLSLNEYCARKLAAPGPSGGPDGWPLLAHAAAVAGPALCGVAVFGSWARGQAGPASDVDLLVVLEEGSPITRGLYRSWDEGPDRDWHGHPVEAHFAALPAEDASLTGLWAEVSMDGLVLYDRDLRLSRRLARFRAAIADGAAVRRWVHGQPYWVAA